MKWITHEKHKELLGRGYSFDHILILKEIDQGFEIDMEDSKVAILHQSLVRKGLLFETENKLTTIGKELLIFVDSKDRKKIVKPKVGNDEFSLWWEQYPRSDSFEYKGKTFTGSRSLRVDKDNCRTLFNKIILEGEVTVKQLIEALQLEVFQKKEKSVKEGSNKLSYMQNSATYLRQKTYDGFLDLINSGVKIVETKSMGGGGTDI